MNTTPKRHGNKWNVNELIALQREFELLNMSVQEIATKHQRTEDSILYRIEQEGFVNNNSEIQLKGMVKQVVNHFMETRRQTQEKKMLTSTYVNNNTKQKQLYL